MEAKYYKKLPERKIECDLCPNKCRVANLERGTCGVRENRNGKYRTLVYGNLCTANIDPVEKKPLFHYFPGTKALSVATAGCNFYCKFCQNWEISQSRPEQVKSFKLMPDDLIQLAKRKRCKTVAHTYTEPVIFFEYVLDSAKSGKKENIPNIMISNGYINKEPMKELCRYIGAVKIDLKAFTEKFYRDICGGKLKPVLKTLELLKAEKVWFEIVVLIIPGLNDSIGEIREMSKWIVKNLGGNIPLHFSRFHPTFMLKNVPPTPAKTLFRCRKIALDSGIKYCYIGNLISDAENTYCHKCSKLIIERSGYHTELTGLKGGKCKYCGERIPGVY